MNTDDSYRLRKQLMWGLLLVGLGGTLLLDQLGMLDVYVLWHYWPLLLVVLGINKMIGYPTARDFTCALWTAFIGVTLILRPFIRERFAVNAASKESSHED